MQLRYVQVRPTPPVSHCPSCKLPDACQVLLKGVAGGFVKEDKVDLFQTALSAFKMLKHGCYHQLRTLTYGETGHAGANGRKGNCLQLLLVGPQERIPCRLNECFTRSKGAPERHPCRMYHVSGLQITTAGNDRLPDGYGTNFVTFFLDRGAALPSDCAGYTAAKYYVVVCGVHDGVNVHFCKVALFNYYLFLHGSSYFFGQDSPAR